MKVYLFIFILLSCSGEVTTDEHNVFSIHSFPHLSKLTGKQYTFPEILMPDRILYKEGNLIVAERSKTALMHLINAETMAYKWNVGLRGVGPGEIPNVWKLQPGFSDDTYWAYSSAGKILAEYSLTDTSKVYMNAIRQREDWFIAMDLTWVDENNLLAFMIDGEDQYVVFDTLGTRTKELGDWRQLIPSLENPFFIADMHQGSLFGNAEKEIFVQACIFRDRFEIINLGTNEILPINGPLNVIPEHTIVGKGISAGLVVDIDTYPMAYNSGSIGTDSIFLLYMGKSDKEMVESNETSKDIFVFDFEGKPTHHFLLDQSISNITVDEKGRKIYGITEGEEPGIAVFDLPEEFL